MTSVLVEREGSASFPTFTLCGISNGQWHGNIDGLCTSDLEDLRDEIERVLAEQAQEKA